MSIRYAASGDLKYLSNCTL